MAMLLLAHAAIPGQIEAATIDHDLRSGSAGEAEGVASACTALGIAHTTIKVNVAPGNLQTEARHARYAALSSWLSERGLIALATAHHADDQAETLLLRLNRGSGVAGLSGIRARTLVPDSRLPLLRPLLGWRRSDLAAVVSAAGVMAAQDPANSDDRFDRARMRKAMAASDWLDIPALATSAANLADADAALDWAAQEEWADCITIEALGITYRPRAPRAIALRVLARIIAELGEEAPRGSAIARLFDRLVRGETASIGSLVTRPGRDGWHFMPAPRRRG